METGTVSIYTLGPEYGKWFQGDIILTKMQKQRLRHSPRNGMIDPKYRWPGNTLIYDIGSGLRSAENLIQTAMSQISSSSCVKFKKRTNEKKYVHFQVKFFSFSSSHI